MDEQDKLVKQRKTKITREFNKLKKIFADADEQKKALANSTLEEMAFIKVQLEELKEHIIKNGAVEIWRNSEKSYGYKQSSAVQSYNSLMKTYNTCQKIIVNDIFKDLSDNQTDELQAFMNSFEDDAK